MEWISVKDKLPHDEGYYNISVNRTVCSGYFIEGKFYDLTFDGSPDFVQPTHWMSLPEPPKQ